MKIIRDEEPFGRFMISLFFDRNVRRGNVEGCKEKPTTSHYSVRVNQIKSMNQFHCWEPPQKIRVIQRGITSQEAALEWGLKQQEKWEGGTLFWLKRREQAIYSTDVFVPAAVEVDLDYLEPTKSIQAASFEEEKCLDCNEYDCRCADYDRAQLS